MVSAKLIAKVVIACSLVASVLFHLQKINTMAEWQRNTDFYKFHHSAAKVLDGESPYTELIAEDRFQRICGHKPQRLLVAELELSHGLVKAPLGYGQCLHPNLNPPFFVVLTLPLAYFNYETAWWMWSIGSLLSALAAGAILAARESGQGILQGASTRWALLSTVLLIWTPAVINTELGQVAMFVLLLLALALRLFDTGAQVSAGILIGICAGMKLFLCLIFVSLLWGRFHQVLKGAIAGFFLTVAIGWLFLGTEAYRDYLYIARLVGWLGDSWNGSWPGMVARIASYTQGVGSPILVFIQYTGMMALLLSAMHAIRSAGRIADPGFSFEYTLLITVMLAILISPLGWKYYYLLLLMHCLFMWKGVDAYAHRRPMRLSIVVFMVLVEIPVSMFNTDGNGTSLADFLYSSVTFLSLLWFYLCFLMFIYLKPSRSNLIRST